MERRPEDVVLEPHLISLPQHVLHLILCRAGAGAAAAACCCTTLRHAWSHVLNDPAQTCAILLERYVSAEMVAKHLYPPYGPSGVQRLGAFVLDQSRSRKASGALDCIFTSLSTTAPTCQSATPNAAALPAFSLVPNDSRADAEDRYALDVVQNLEAQYADEILPSEVSKMVCFGAALAGHERVVLHLLPHVKPVTPLRGAAMAGNVRLCTALMAAFEIFYRVLVTADKGLPWRQVAEAAAGVEGGVGEGPEQEAVDKEVRDMCVELAEGLLGLVCTCAPCTPYEQGRGVHVPDQGCTAGGVRGEGSSSSSGGGDGGGDGHAAGGGSRGGAGQDVMEVSATGSSSSSSSSGSSSGSSSSTLSGGDQDLQSITTAAAAAAAAARAAAASSLAAAGPGPREAAYRATAAAAAAALLAQSATNPAPTAAVAAAASGCTAPDATTARSPQGPLSPSAHASSAPPSPPWASTPQHAAAYTTSNSSSSADGSRAHGSDSASSGGTCAESSTPSCLGSPQARAGQGSPAAHGQALTPPPTANHLAVARLMIHVWGADLRSDNELALRTAVCAAGSGAMAAELIRAGADPRVFWSSALQLAQVAASGRWDLIDGVLSASGLPPRVVLAMWGLLWVQCVRVRVEQMWARSAGSGFFAGVVWWLWRLAIAPMQVAWASLWVALWWAWG